MSLLPPSHASDQRKASTASVEPVAFFEAPRLQALQGWRVLALIASSVAIGVGLHAASQALWAIQTDAVGVTVVHRPASPHASPSSSEQTRVHETIGFLRGRADELRGCGVVQLGTASLSVTALKNGTLMAAVTSPSATPAASCAALVITGWQLESSAEASVQLDVDLVFGTSPSAAVHELSASA